MPRPNTCCTPPTQQFDRLETLGARRRCDSLGVYRRARVYSRVQAEAPSNLRPVETDCAPEVRNLRKPAVGRQLVDVLRTDSEAGGQLRRCEELVRVRRGSRQRW